MVFSVNCCCSVKMKRRLCYITLAFLGVCLELTHGVKTTPAHIGQAKGRYLVNTEEGVADKIRDESSLEEEYVLIGDPVVPDLYNRVDFVNSKLPNEQFKSIDRRSRPHTDTSSRNGRIMTSSSRTAARGRRAVTSLLDRLWSNGIIPYIIGQNVTDYVRQNINQAMVQWEKYTCIKFVNRIHQTDYVIFNPGSCGCCSFVGRRGGAQDVSLSTHCAVYGVVLHELGHVIGFWHEHSRPDRDKYITLLTANILDEKLENFAKKPESEINSLGQPYDYHSIMHYRKNTFSKNSRNTIIPNTRDVHIGQRDRLSPGDVLQTNLLYHCPKPICYEEFINSHGSFSTPNYPINYHKNHNCTWIIHALPGEEITLEFDEFDLERAPNCSFDYIEVRQGIDETGLLVGRLCGHGFPGFFQSRTSIWVNFVSDSSFARKGFLAHYHKSVSGDSFTSSASGSGSWDGYNVRSGSRLKSTSYDARCNEYLSAPRGDLLTPLVPVWYSGKPVECSWTIDGGKKTHRILLQIYPSDPGTDIEECAGSVYQRVVHIMRHKGGHGDPYRKNKLANQSKKDYNQFYQVERYGSVRYNCMTSRRLVLNTSTIMIQWSADTNTEFSASYLIDYNECELGIHRCQHYCHNTLENYYCTCRTGFLLQPGGYKCLPKAMDVLDRCGGNLTSERGKIRAGTEPVEDCFYFVYLPPNSRIQLVFTKFLVPAPVVKNGTCIHSYVEVLMGKTMHSKGRYCGRTGPSVISASTDQLTIRVHANLRKIYFLPYFSAKYIIMQQQSSQGRCFYKMKARGATIKSPGYPRQYAPDSFCVWRLSARKGERINMTFDLFDLEQTKLCSFDYVEVYDGKHASGPVIGRFCGQTMPNPVISSGKYIRVMFVSDGTGSGRGFKAHFNTISSKT